MDNSIYIALSYQLTRFRDLEVTANNIANMNTPGYNAEKLLFAQHLERNVDDQDAYVTDPLSYRDTSRGSFRNTGNPLDLAINGNAYFQVQTPLGIRYTKAGNFQLNDAGIIVTNDGHAVLGAGGGEVTLPANTRNIVINGAGEVSADGETVGQIGMVEFTNEQAMKRAGNTLFTAEEAPQPSITARMVQGAVESSNVSGVTQMTRIIELQRSVSSSARMIETMYDLQRRASQIYTRNAQG